MSRRRLTVALSAWLLISATACAGDDGDDVAPVVQLGAPGESSRVLGADEIATIEVPGYTDADVEFVHGMLAHHQQALVMTAMVADRSDNESIMLLTERMDISQVEEIAQMERWLDERGENLADGHDHMGHMGTMPGMLSDAELDEIAAASGTTFDRLFLEGMIRHHLGATVMVETLLTGGFGGQEPEVFQFAQHVASDQAIEVARMSELLASMNPPS